MALLNLPALGRAIPFWIRLCVGWLLGCPFGIRARVAFGVTLLPPNGLRRGIIDVDAFTVSWAWQDILA